MQQKKINDILYVFDFTPYEITQDTDAEIIKVQEESYAGFIALNESLADKIVKYNYNMMTVQPLEWAPYIESKEYEFTISGWNWEESITVTIDGEPQEVHDSYELYEGAVIEIAPVDGNSIYDYYVAVNDIYVAPVDDKWTFTMESPEGIAVTVGYGEPKTIYFDATNITSSNLSVNSFGVDLGIQSEYTLRTGQNTLISFAPTEGSEEYTASDNMIWNAEEACWQVNYYNIEDDDTISLEYNGQPVVTGHTLTLDGDDIHAHVSVMFDGGEVATQYEYNDIAEGTRIEIHPTDDPSNYTLVAGAEWDANSNCWTYTMGVIDWTITINYTEPVSTITLTAPDGLAIYDEEWGSWVSMEQDLSDPSLAIGEITPGKTYSVEQRNGIGQGMDVTFSPSCGTGQQGTVGAAFIAPNEDLTITLSQPVPQENQGVTVTYNVNNTSQAATIWSGDAGSAPDQMFVDGVRQTVADTYQFSTTGSHTIQYVFNDHILDITFQLSDQTTPIEITGFQVGSDIEEVTGNAWVVKQFDAGESDMVDVEQTYLPTTPPTITGLGESGERPGVTIYVPSDSVSAYQNASIWSDISALIQAIPVQ